MNFLVPPSDMPEFNRIVSQRLRGWYLEKQTEERVDRRSKIRNFSSYRAFSKYLEERFGYSVNHKSIENYFRGQQRLSAYAMTAICEGLGKSLVEAVYGVDPTLEQNMAIIKVLETVRDLPRYHDELDPESREILGQLQGMSREYRAFILTLILGRNLVEALEEALKEARRLQEDDSEEDKE
jgi:hypothetical protein